MADRVGNVGQKFDYIIVGAGSAGCGYGESACPRNLLMAIEKRLFLQGFLVSDHLSDRAAFIKQINEWLKSGEITFRQTVEHGIEQAPAAFLKLFAGGDWLAVS
jgi:NADPH-dependent curcumin reductase CurA